MEAAARGSAQSWATEQCSTGVVGLLRGRRRPQDGVREVSAILVRHQPATKVYDATELDPLGTWRTDFGSIDSLSFCSLSIDPRRDTSDTTHLSSRRATTRWWDASWRLPRQRPLRRLLRRQVRRSQRPDVGIRGRRGCLHGGCGQSPAFCHSGGGHPVGMPPVTFRATRRYVAATP